MQKIEKMLCFDASKLQRAMDTAETALYPVAAMKEAPQQSQEAYPIRDGHHAVAFERYADDVLMHCKTVQQAEGHAY